MTDLNYTEYFKCKEIFPILFCGYTVLVKYYVKGKKTQRVKKNRTSPNLKKVARRFNIVSYQENRDTDNTLSDDEPCLREVQKQLQNVTKKIEEIDLKSK